MSRSILVTGCTGLVGHGIVLTLLEHGYEVWGTSRMPMRSRHPRFRPVILDLKDETSMRALTSVLDNVDTVIHNAAKLQQPVGDGDAGWEEYFAVNMIATRELLAASSKCSVRQFIYISGSGLLDESVTPLDENTPFLPRNDYTASKAAAELVCRQFDVEGRLRTCILRFPAPYGYRGASSAVLPQFIKKVRAGLPISLWGTGGRQQLFTFVEDIGQACVKAIEASACGVFHIAGPEVVTMKQLAESVLQTFPGTGSRVVYEAVPDPQEHRTIAISIEKARRELGYQPAVSLLHGLRKIASADEAINVFENIH